MGAKIGNKNAEGNRGGGGKSLQDRKLAADVRILALKEIKKILSKGQVKDNKDLYRAVLIRLTGTILPRLTELTGEDGERLFPSPILSNILNTKKDENNKQENIKCSAENL